jgi:protein-S-isoprenylcysteine O-methyltransferase Ste14
MKLVEIALAWLAYFILHSLLADSSVKAWIHGRYPGLMPGYRLAFNVIALLTLLPVLWLVYRPDGDWLWQWRGIMGWIANGLALIALLCFFISTREYDMGEFLGLNPWRGRGGAESPAFTLSYFHRHVRHPWYCFGLVLVWTHDMNAALLVSAVAITFYIIVGSRLEERKLIVQYGEKYKRYMQRVPGLMPVPGRHLTAAEARALLES